MTLTGQELPRLRTAVPGPRSTALVDTLARRECAAITARRSRSYALGADRFDPIVWEEARGAVVRDVDDNLFIDMEAGFGVAFVGHRHPAVVAAARAQQDKLLHAMGDVFPDVTRIRMMDRLAGLCPPGLDTMILGLSGSDAVEAAIKTGIMASGRHGVLAFDGAYHGLTVGNTPLQGYSPDFSAPFKPILNPLVWQLPWGAPIEQIVALLAEGRVGTVIVEPVQGRGGMRAAPEGWIAAIARAARAAGAVVVFDEVQSGLGRTGAMWAGTAEGVIPDLLCVGKTLGGGFPISACVGTRAVMDAWGPSTGEALHTQTFLGHPMGTAAALAVMDLIEGEDLPRRAASLAAWLRAELLSAGFQTRGRGLMIGVHVPDPIAASRGLLERGFIALPSGSGAAVLGIIPPVVLTEAQGQAFVAALSEAVGA
ncbi:MAG: aminotransferase class III-fold pyridoxal phosphate-dependent enzyme [Deltaproteobacteria bacterium]|nr:aminotransferase class III-fold pyridoxal phosphate-dependent enzyme [Deltaproteobacteria bacterium]